LPSTLVYGKGGKEGAARCSKSMKKKEFVLSASAHCNRKGGKKKARKEKKREQPGRLRRRRGVKGREICFSTFSSNIEAEEEKRGEGEKERAPSCPADAERVKKGGKFGRNLASILMIFTGGERRKRGGKRTVPPDFTMPREGRGREFSPHRRFPRRKKEERKEERVSLGKIERKRKGGRKKRAVSTQCSCEKGKKKKQAIKLKKERVCY